MDLPRALGDAAIDGPSHMDTKPHPCRWHILCFSTAAMLGELLDSSARAGSRPAVWLLPLCGSLTLECALHFWSWPQVSFRALPASGIGTVTAILCLRAWLSLSVLSIAIAGARGEARSIRAEWVPPDVAVRAIFVTAVLLAPILVSCLLILPGILLALAWSQATPLIVDRKAQAFDAAELSSLLTRGARLHVLAVWTGLVLLLLAVEGVDQAIASGGASLGPTAVSVMRLLLSSSLDTVVLCTTAATYVLLIDHASHEREEGNLLKGPVLS